MIHLFTVQYCQGDEDITEHGDPRDADQIRLWPVDGDEPLAVAEFRPRARRADRAWHLVSTTLWVAGGPRTPVYGDGSVAWILGYLNPRLALIGDIMWEKGTRAPESFCEAMAPAFAALAKSGQYGHRVTSDTWHTSDPYAERGYCGLTREGDVTGPFGDLPAGSWILHEKRYRNLDKERNLFLIDTQYELMFIDTDGYLYFGRGLDPLGMDFIRLSRRIDGIWYTPEFQ